MRMSHGLVRRIGMTSVMSVATVSRDHASVATLKNRNRSRSLVTSCSKRSSILREDAGVCTGASDDLVDARLREAARKKSRVGLSAVFFGPRRVLDEQCELERASEREC